MNDHKIVLTDGQIDTINATRRILTDLVPEMDAAERCGIDCSKHRQEKDRIMQGLDNIIAHFSRKTG